MAANRFDQLIESWWTIIRDAFFRSFRTIRSWAQIGLIAERLEKGDIDGAIKAVGLDPVAFRDLDKSIADAFEAGGVHTVQGFPVLREPTGHKLEVRFDVRNPRAEAWLRDHSSNLITDIVADQRTMIRNALRASMEAGQNPRAAALDLVGRINPVTKRREGGLIGLTTSQEEWVRRYAEELASGDANALTRTLRDRRFDRTVAKAIREDGTIPADKQAKMVAAYRNRALQYRAETIGRTEALTSLHVAQMEATRQAIDAGQIDEAAVLKVWHNSGDNRVRDTHRALGGQTVAFEAKFLSPSGAQLRFPGDPEAPARETVMCRCWMETKVDFLAGIT